METPRKLIETFDKLPIPIISQIIHVNIKYSKTINLFNRVKRVDRALANRKAPKKQTTKSCLQFFEKLPINTVLCKKNQSLHVDGKHCISR